jgi:hypothetical protein
VFRQHDSGEPFPVPTAELLFEIRSKVRVSSNGKSEVSQEIMSDGETKALANELLGQETDEEAKRKEKSKTGKRGKKE